MTQFRFLFFLLILTTSVLTISVVTAEEICDETGCYDWDRTREVTCSGNDTMKIFKEVMNDSEIESFYKDIANLYGNCTEDLRKGTFCGMGYQMLEDSHEVLLKQRTELLRENGKLEGYKNGFYIISAITILLALFLIIKAIREKTIKA